MITKPMDVLINYQIRKSKKQKTAFISAVTAYAASQRYSTKIETGSFGCRNIVIGDAENADYLITAHYDTCAWMPLPNLVTPFNMPIYILYQVLLVVAMLLMVILPGLAATVFSQDEMISSLIGFIGYWVVLILLVAGPANRRTANDNTSGVITLLEIMTSLPEKYRGKVCFVLFDLEEAGLIGSITYRKSHKVATDKQIVLNMDCVGDGDEIVLIPSKRIRNNENSISQLHALAGTWGRKSLSVHKAASPKP